MNLSLNPYGLTYTVGLQGANPDAIGLAGFAALVRELGLRAIELDHRWLTPLTDDRLRDLSVELEGLQPICSFWLSHQPGETLHEAVRCCRALGARILRFHLTPVLEGGRARWGERWQQMRAHADAVLTAESARIADAGLVLAVENHQDMGSEDLIELTERLGAHAGICFDTGNAFAVGEDPVAFARRAAHRIRHVHLKDYVAEFTGEGFRLIRCAIGDGAVPFAEIAAVLTGGDELAASIEPGALEARHIRLFTADWWTGYRSREARELGVMLGRLRSAMLPAGSDYRTPWEAGAEPRVIADYERAQVLRSVRNVREMGIAG